MKNRFNIGDHVYIVESGLYIKEVVVVGVAGGFYRLCYPDRQGALRLKESRLFATKEEADGVWSSGKAAHLKKQTRKGFRSPYDYEW